VSAYLYMITYFLRKTGKTTSTTTQKPVPIF